MYKYDIYLVVPNGFDCSYYNRFDGVEVRQFPLHFFEGLKGYNALLLSSMFFKEFLLYKYMLIYQLDCFVFRDELTKWCSMNFDYIGAPWLEVSWLYESHKIISKNLLKKRSALIKPLVRLKWKLKGLNNPENFRVGNGGLSLRNVKSSYKATKKYKKEILTWAFSEDFFYSFFLPLSGDTFVIPSAEQALYFSFDTNPNLCYKRTQFVLPFGCHGWCRTDDPYTNNLEFWLPIVKQHMKDRSIG
nr:DUF5672 family protein [Chryseolinea sp. H1M3-3]